MPKLKFRTRGRTKRQEIFQQHTKLMIIYIFGGETSEFVLRLTINIPYELTNFGGMNSFDIFLNFAGLI